MLGLLVFIGSERYWTNGHDTKSSALIKEFAFSLCVASENSVCRHKRVNEKLP